MDLPQYAVYALRYATVARQPHENFIAADPHEQATTMDYFIWAIVGDGRVVVVDTGFTAEAAHQRRRQFLRCPAQALAPLGIAADAVADVVLTHLHYDHAGNLDLFPAARFHVQAREMAFATGPCMCEPFLRHAYDVDDVVQLLRHAYAGRVQFHEGDVTPWPGISLHHVGGHTDGLQAVRVYTRRGWVVLASDAAHYGQNLRRRSPFPIVYHVGDMLRGYDRLLQLADSPAHVVPGHDPAVLRDYPAVAPDCADIVQLHTEPRCR